MDLQKDNEDKQKIVGKVSVKATFVLPPAPTSTSHQQSENEKPSKSRQIVQEFNAGMKSGSNGYSELVDLVKQAQAESDSLLTSIINEEKVNKSGKTQNEKNKKN